MTYIDWWEPFSLSRMAPYYYMFCTPGQVKRSVNGKAKYDFQFQYFKIRGYEYYRQRMWKGKWRH